MPQRKQKTVWMSPLHTPVKPINWKSLIMRERTLEDLLVFLSILKTINTVITIRIVSTRKVNQTHNNLEPGEFSHWTLGKETQLYAAGQENYTQPEAEAANQMR